jgi:hypothetical protein
MIPGRKHLVFEEGLQSAWLYETLRPHVEELVVAGITESRGERDCLVVIGIPGTVDERDPTATRSLDELVD